MFARTIFFIHASELFRRSRRLRRPSQSSRRKRRRSRHWNRSPTPKSVPNDKSDPFFVTQKTPPQPSAENFIFDCFLTIFGRFRVMSIRNLFSKRISRTVWAQNFQKRCLRYWLKWSAWSKKWHWEAFLDILNALCVLQFHRLVICVNIDEIRWRF